MRRVSAKKMSQAAA